MAVLDLVLGPTVIGVLFNVYLYGTMCTQCYHYFMAFAEDARRVRFLVWFLLIADTANTIFECVVLYEYTITDFGDFVAVGKGNWRAGTGPILTGIIAAAVQHYFAWRVYRLTRMKWIAIPIYAGIVIQCVAATCVGIAGTIIAPFAEWDRWQVKVPIIIWLVLAAVVDCAITAILTYYLRSSRTGFPSTDYLITKLIRLTVETGMITAIWAVLDLILYLSYPKPIHLIFNLALPKLYSNTLLSMLNSRLRGGAYSSGSANVVSDITWKERAKPTISGVHVSTTSQVHRDEIELASTSKKDFVVPTNPEDEVDEVDNKSASSDLDLEANRRSHGEYALNWAKAPASNS